MPEKKARIKQGPTMADVARLAGVNRVTASVALRGANASTRISEATRQRILEAARQLGYTPNMHALALRGIRTNIIGYYVGTGFDPFEPFSAAIMSGLQQACSLHKCDVLFYTGLGWRSPDDVYALMAGGVVDGLIVLPSAVPDPALERLIQTQPVPMVTIANSSPLLPAVVVDDVAGSRLLASYLVTRGYHSVLYRRPPFQITSSERRCDAFCEAAAEMGLHVIVRVTDNWSGNLSDAEFSWLSEARATHTLPDVAVCWVDAYAYNFIEGCCQRGWRVPEDIAVVGFDGISLRVPLAWQLTTIHAPWKQVAEVAINKLLALLDGQEVEAETAIAVELVVGKTA